MYEPSVDLQARQCVMASMLYYGLDVPMMTDHEYDAKVRFVIEHWDMLTPMRQWMLRTKQDFSASGFRCRVTTMAADATVIWLRMHKLLQGRPETYPVQITKRWQHDKRQNLRWLPPDGFAWRNVR